MEKEMNEKEYKDTLSVLEDMREALKGNDMEKLEDSSDHLIHCVSIYQSKRTMLVGVIAYSLAKILKKEKIEEEHTKEREKFLKAISKNLKMCEDYLKGKKYEKYNESIKTILREIKEFDEKFSKYLKHVLKFSKEQKGKKIYKHGLSLSKVADMLGISKWSLMEKAGEEKEEKGGKKSPSTRLKETEKILKEEE